MTSNNGPRLAAVARSFVGSIRSTDAQTITVDIEDASVLDVPSTAIVAESCMISGQSSRGRLRSDARRATRNSAM